MKQLTKLPPAWHADAATQLRSLFEATHALFLDSTRKAVFLGLCLEYTKRRGKEDKSIPHGEFRSWITRNLPGLSFDTCAVYMGLARNVAEKGKFQISDYPTFAHDGKLPRSAEALIAGKTQHQLFLEFKQTDADGNPRPGRRPGHSALRAPLSTLEQAAQLRALAREDSGRMGAAIAASNKNFFLLTEANDLELNAQVALLEHALRLRRHWLALPKPKRDPALLQPMLQRAPVP